MEGGESRAGRNGHRKKKGKKSAVDGIRNSNKLRASTKKKVTGRAGEREEQRERERGKIKKEEEGKEKGRLRREEEN